MPKGAPLHQKISIKNRNIIFDKYLTYLTKLPGIWQIWWYLKTKTCLQQIIHYLLSNTTKFVKYSSICQIPCYLTENIWRRNDPLARIFSTVGSCLLFSVLNKEILTWVVSPNLVTKTITMMIGGWTKKSVPSPFPTKVCALCYYPRS